MEIAQVLETAKPLGKARGHLYQGKILTHSYNTDFFALHFQDI